MNGIRAIWRPFTMAATGLALVFAMPMTTATGKDGWITAAPEEPLANAKSYVLTGTDTKSGCRFEDEELLLPDGWSAIERRDVAIDLVNCRKIVEVGQPKTFGPKAMPFSVGDSRASETGEGLLSPTHWKQGYYGVWWTDVFDLLVVGAESDITWWISGGCVTDGAGTGGMALARWSGWKFLNQLWSSTRNCSQYVGTYSGYGKNPSFCSPLVVWANLELVKAKGYSGGSIGGSNGADVVNECLPLTKHEQAAITASGNGGP